MPTAFVLVAGGVFGPVLLQRVLRGDFVAETVFRTRGAAAFAPLKQSRFPRMTNGKLAWGVCAPRLVWAEALFVGANAEPVRR
jgi:hypothetical protein